jgi:hypothetical protein
MTSTSDPVTDLLALNPRRARGDEHDEDGTAWILVPRFGGRFLGRWLQPRLRRPFFRIRLDAVGTFVWDRADGTRDGETIARELAEAFPDLVKPRERLAIFLRQLLGQGHIEVGRML